MFKSSNNHIWPILGSFGHSHPFTISLYGGNSKPDSIEEFIETFLGEIENSKLHGIYHNDKHIDVKLYCFTCDAPARQLLKGTKGHTGYYACERCQIAGRRVENRMAFLNVHDKSRTDADFNQRAYADHQVSYSPLINTDDY